MNKSFPIMPDLGNPTPLGPVEAPFVWFWLALGSMAWSYLPLLFVFQNVKRREQWRAYFSDSVPRLITMHPMVYYILLFIFVLSATISYWLCRAGHSYAETHALSIVSTISLSLFSWWSWPAFFYLHALSVLLFLAFVAMYGVYVVIIFVSYTWYAGVIALIGWIILFVLFWKWFLYARRKKPRPSNA